MAILYTHGSTPQLLTVDTAEHEVGNFYSSSHCMRFFTETTDLSGGGSYQHRLVFMP